MRGGILENFKLSIVLGMALLTASCSDDTAASPDTTVDAGAVSDSRDAATALDASDRPRDGNATGLDARAPEDVDAGPGSSPLGTATRDAQVDASAAPPGDVVDCTKATGLCMEARGVRDGQPFSCSGRTESTAWAFSSFDEAWHLTCHERDSTFFVTVNIPTQAQGPLQYSADRAELDGFWFSLQVGQLSKSIASDPLSGNLESGSFTGAIAADGSITGTLSASWGAPMPGCRNADGTACVPASLRMTLHVPPQR